MARFHHLAGGSHAFTLLVLARPVGDRPCALPSTTGWRSTGPASTGPNAPSRRSPLLPRAHSQTGRPFTQVRIYVSGDGRLCWWACVTVPE